MQLTFQRLKALLVLAALGLELLVALPIPVVGLLTGLSPLADLVGIQAALAAVGGLYPD